MHTRTGTGFWATIRGILPTAIKAPEELATYTAGLFGLCALLLCLGFATVLVAPFLRSGVQNGVSTFVVTLLSALMSLSAGAILGLLFGIPRYSKLNEVDNAVAPNNNLEQISDWLTKMIVGIGLVESELIVAKTKRLALQITLEMTGCEAPVCQGHYALGLAVIGFFAAAGFLMMYLWARVYLLLDVGSVQLKIDRDAVAFKDFLKNPERIQGKQRHRERARRAAEAGSAAMNLADDARIRPGPDADDPWKGAFGGQVRDEAAARELTASVRPVEGSKDYCAVRLVVRSTDSAKPLKAEVKFFLHDTFPQPIQTVQAKDNNAELEVVAWGAFTVGVLADGGQTKLELDLSTIESSPAEWRAR